MKHVRLVILLIFFASLPIVVKSQVVSVPFTNDNPNGLVIVPAQLGNIPVRLFFIGFCLSVTDMLDRDRYAVS
jgi:hypothetical protein